VSGQVHTLAAVCLVKEPSDTQFRVLVGMKIGWDVLEKKRNLLTLPVIRSQFSSLVFIGCLGEEAVFVGDKARM